jgi:transglutaminase-like putative cysteine protease
LTTIPAGKAGTKKTIQKMAQLARQSSLNPTLSTLAINLGNVHAIEHFVVSNSVYRYEQMEIIRQPEWMLNDLYTQGYMEGDCDDFTTLEASLCKAIGVGSRIVAVRTEANNPDYDHVFLEIPTATGTAFRMDATVHPEIVIPEVERMVEYV